MNRDGGTEKTLPPLGGLNTCIVDHTFLVKFKGHLTF